MPLTLRPEQSEAIQSVYSHYQEHDGDPLVVLPTGTGKSLVQAELAKGIIAPFPATRILCLAPSKELIEQNASEILGQWPGAPVGIYCAGLDHRDLHSQITVASIQSIYKRAHELPAFHVVIVDECHLIPRKANAMYQTLFTALREKYPELRIIGLTATPFRLASGSLIEGEDAMFSRICYELSMTTAIEKGYLCPLTTKRTETHLDTSDVAIRGGEFVQKELAAAVDKDDVTSAAVDEIIKHAGTERRSWLIFATSQKHAQHIHEHLIARGITSACVTSKTPKKERDQSVQIFRNGQIRALVNVNCFTTGFNVKRVDLIAMLRPTESPGLYVQKGGRGTRLFPGKKNCLVLDFARNIERHGPIDDPTPPKSRKAGKRDSEPVVKFCPECGEYAHLGARYCAACDHEFEFSERKPDIQSKPSDADIMSNGDSAEAMLKKYAPRSFEPYDTDYSSHLKKGKSVPVLRAMYFETFEIIHSEWICFEHESPWARGNAERWWLERGGELPVPVTVAEAKERCRELFIPTKVTVALDPKNDRWERVLGVECEGERRPEPPKEHELVAANYNKAVKERALKDAFQDEIPF